MEDNKNRGEFTGIKDLINTVPVSKKYFPDGVQVLADTVKELVRAEDETEGAVTVSAYLGSYDIFNDTIAPLAETSAGDGVIVLVARVRWDVEDVMGELVNIAGEMTAAQEVEEAEAAAAAALIARDEARAEVERLEAELARLRGK